MENFYKLNSLLSCAEDVVRGVNVSVSAAAASELNLGLVANNFLQLEEPESSDISERFIKTQIATHPLYPNLVSAYIECRKVMPLPYQLSFLSFFQLILVLLFVLYSLSICMPDINSQSYRNSAVNIKNKWKL